MMDRLAKPVRQAVALALLVVAIWALSLLTVVPLAAKISDLQDRLERERTVLGRLNAATRDGGSGVEAEQRALAGRIGNLFIQGESESIRVASVQSQVMAILGAQRVKPRSTRNLPARERNNLRLVGVQLQLTAPIEQLQAVLLDIEAHKPLLFVEAMHISPVNVSGVPGEDLRGMLDARLDVFGVEKQQKGQ